MGCWTVGSLFIACYWLESSLSFLSCGPPQGRSQCGIWLHQSKQEDKHNRKPKSFWDLILEVTTHHFWDLILEGTCFIHDKWVCRLAYTQEEGLGKDMHTRRWRTLESFWCCLLFWDFGGKWYFWLHSTYVATAWFSWGRISIFLDEEDWKLSQSHPLGFRVSESFT